mmetsp:Transcript_62764/g.72037  ORF Transcript_62764/g.72037 Transcript_62764/m.72037 type:complete len:561 (+) Transcript_62764:93-1775(+)
MEVEKKRSLKRTSRSASQLQPLTARDKRMLSSHLSTANLQRNVNATLESTSDSNEKKEIAQVLQRLRKRYDLFKREGDEFEQRIQQANEEMQQIDQTELSAAGNDNKVLSKIESKKREVEVLKAKIEEVLQDKKTYQHMVERMKKERLIFEANKKELEKNLSKKQDIVKSESFRLLKAKEGQKQTQYALTGLRRDVKRENKKQKDTIGLLSKTIEAKHHEVSKRESRNKRQQEIAETAAAEGRDAKEIALREHALLHQFLRHFLKNKMDNEMQRNQATEEAYQKIRTATGLTDINDIVSKFLTREQAYTDLVNAVQEAENKVEALKKINEDYKSRLQDLKIFSVNDGNRSFKSLDEAEHHHKEEAKLLQELLEKHNQHRIELNQIKKWVPDQVERLEEMHHKDNGQVLSFRLDEIYKPQSGLFEKKDGDTLEAFSNVRDIMLAALKKLEESAEDEQMAEILKQKTSTEISLEEKNIRVNAGNSTLPGLGMDSEQTQRNDDDYEDEVMMDLIEVRKELKKTAHRHGKGDETGRRHHRRYKNQQNHQVSTSRSGGVTLPKIV